MAKPQNTPVSEPHAALPMVLLLFGISLIAASFFNLGNFAAQSQWSVEDSAIYDKTTREYKRSSYRSSSRAGLTEAEWEAQRMRMKQRIDEMNVRLENARQQPKQWSRYLLWGGALLAVIGVLLQKRQAGN